MGQKSISTLRQQIIDNIYTNIANDIEGDDVQNQLVDLLDTVAGSENILSIASGVTNKIVVGTTSNDFIEIIYTIKRGTLFEKGVITMTGKNDAIIDVISKFDDCGFTFTKTLNMANIELNYTDVLVDGNSSDVILKIKYY